jgi:hypothetical protein
MYDVIVKAGGARLKVGVFDGVGGGTGEIATIATIHEFGAPRANIPPRSYIRATIRERKAELAALMARVVRLMIQGKLDERRALELVGAWLAGAIKGRIVSGPFTPLKPATIARRRKNPADPDGPIKPLIDTGQLKNAVTFIIVD